MYPKGKSGDALLLQMAQSTKAEMRMGISLNAKQRGRIF